MVQVGRIPCGVLLVLVALGCCSESTPPSASPTGVLAGSSVVVVTLDTTRRDALGSYSGRDTSPFLDRLAARGVLFDRARTVAPLTLPAHGSLFTGLYPFEHGARDNGTFRVADDIPTLAECLRDAGYRCGAVIGGAVLNSGYGLARGFEDYRDTFAKEEGRAHYRVAEKVTQLGLQWLQIACRDSRPFFLWVHFFDPHHPLQPPPQYVREAGDGVGSHGRADRERRLYDGEVAYVDAQIRRLHEGLEDLLLASSSGRPRSQVLWVVVSDHGEGLGDHGELAHGYFLYESTMAIPLFLVHPALAPRRVEEEVSLVDLLPTTLSLLGFESPACSGLDLSGVVLGKAGIGAPRVLYMESCYPFTNHRWSPLYGLVEGSLKFIHSPRSQLYDLSSDPEEQVNLLTRRPEVGERLRRSLQELASRARPVSRRSLGEEERQALQALGYLATEPAVGQDRAFIPGTMDPALRDTQDTAQLIEWHNLALTKFIRGDREGAIQLMLKIIDEDPEDPIFLEQAGAFLVHAGRFQQAAELLQRAADLWPYSPTVWRNLASAFDSLGRGEDALRALQSLLEANPEDLEGHLDLARRLSERQQKPAAIALLEALVRRLGMDPAHQHKRSQVLSLIESIRQKGD
jgi:arylsulfatase A-like enzyme